MKMTCAWCHENIELDDNSMGESTEEMISHGICHKCQDNIKFQKGGSLQDYIETLDVPILATDAEGKVVAVNRPGEAFVEKGRNTICGHFLGDVFECAHARLPEGCGRTIHCSGCAIRQSIRSTLATGQSCINVPATLKFESDIKNAKIDFVITTMKVLGIILLRIDKGHPGNSPAGVAQP